MKNAGLLLIFLLKLTVLVHATGFTIKGRITGKYDGYVYLSYENVRDSTLVRDNNFVFKGKLDKPIPGWLNLSPPTNPARVFLENSPIFIEGNVITTIENNQKLNLFSITRITGSNSQRILDEYREFSSANETKENFNALRFEELKRMFTKNPREAVNGWILANIIVNRTAYKHAEFFELFTLLDTTTLQHSDVSIIRTALIEINEYGIGLPFIAFDLPNQSQQIISSEKYSGKILLVEFWASWCGPCRAMHPTLIGLQKKYQNQNFEVVSISLDNDLVVWREAITKDNLTWDNLIDPGRKLVNELGVLSIPFNYLVDENGIIVDVNLPLEKIDKILQGKSK